MGKKAVNKKPKNIWPYKHKQILQLLSSILQKLFENSKLYEMYECTEKPNTQRRETHGTLAICWINIEVIPHKQTIELSITISTETYMQLTFILIHMCPIDWVFLTIKKVLWCMKYSGTYRAISPGEIKSLYYITSLFNIVKWTVTVLCKKCLFTEVMIFQCYHGYSLVVYCDWLLSWWRDNFSV